MKTTKTRRIICMLLAIIMTMSLCSCALPTFEAAETAQEGAELENTTAEETVSLTFDEAGEPVVKEIEEGEEAPAEPVEGEDAEPVEGEEAAEGENAEEVDEVKALREEQNVDGSALYITEECDATADVATAEQFEAAAYAAAASDDWAANIVSVARSQIGYCESSANFAVDKNGEHKGYTLYGNYFGYPYGDWSAMFAAFCVEAANVPPEFPVDYDSQSYMADLSEGGMLGTVEAYSPKAGDLVFFDMDGDNAADYTGIVSEVKGINLKAVVGNLNNFVSELDCKITDENIIGYGILPIYNIEPEEPAAPSAEEVYAGFKTMSEADRLAAFNALDAEQSDAVLALALENTSERKLEKKLADGSVVTVEGLLPDIADLSVVDITAQYASKSAQEVFNVGVSKTLKAVYDITIVVLGNSYDVPQTVKVRMSSPKIAKDANVDVIHLDDGNNAEQVASAKTNAKGEVEFDADSFSPYAFYVDSFVNVNEGNSTIRVLYVDAATGTVLNPNRTDQDLGGNIQILNNKNGQITTWLPEGYTLAGEYYCNSTLIEDEEAYIPGGNTLYVICDPIEQGYVTIKFIDAEGNPIPDAADVPSVIGAGLTVGQLKTNTVDKLSLPSGYVIRESKYNHSGTVVPVNESILANRVSDGDQYLIVCAPEAATGSYTVYYQSINGNTLTKYTTYTETKNFVVGETDTVTVADIEDKLTRLLDEGYLFAGYYLNDAKITTETITVEDGDEIIVLYEKPLSVTYIDVLSTETQIGDTESVEVVGSKTIAGLNLEAPAEYEIVGYRYDGTKTSDSTAVENGHSLEVLCVPTFDKAARDFCDEYYETHDQGSVDIIGPTGGVDLTKVKAGDTLNYVLQYKVFGAPTWEGRRNDAYGIRDYDAKKTLYDNSTVKVSIKLPEGVELAAIGTASHWTYNTETKAYEYTFTNNGKEKSETETFSLFVKGNGTENAIRTINDLEAKVEVTFTPLDKRTSTPTPVKDVGGERDFVCTTDDDDTVPGFTTVSDDKWVVKKEAVSAVVNNAQSQVTVKYKISVGFVDKDGNLIKEGDAAYTKEGRVAIENMTLNGTLNDTFQDMNPESEAVTIRPSSATLKKGTGTAKTVTVAADGTISVPLTGDLALATSGNLKVKSGDNIETSVPWFTNYELSLVYDISGDKLPAFYDTNNNKLSFNNAVVDNYKLYNMPADSSNDSAANNAELEPVKPAKLNISKKLQEYQGNVVDYVDATHYGAISYTLSADSAFSVYTKSGSAYVNPVAATLIDGKYVVEGLSAKTDYYIPAGINYTVSEAMNPVQQNQMVFDEGNSKDLTKAPAANSTWNPLVRNNELKGKITINKVDDYNHPLAGVTFALTHLDDSGAQIGDAVIAVTDSKGTAVFDGLAYGKYHVEETIAPAGYSGTVEKDVVINADNPTVTIGSNEAINSKQFVTINLNKYVGITEAADKTSMQKAASDAFKNQFKLQYKYEGIDWTDATNANAVNGALDTTLSDGSVTLNVYAFIDNKPVTYRFVETIPEGYYDPANPDAATANSAEIVTVENGKAKDGTLSVDMFNRQKVTVSVTKKFFDITASGGTVENTEKATTVTLYKRVGESMQPVEDTTAKTIKSSETAVWSGLKPYNEEDKEPIEFYVSETDVDGYKLDAGASVGGSNAVTIDGKVYLPIAVENATPSGTLYNIQQKVPVTIYKKNSYSNAWVDNCYVTVKDNNGTAVEGGNNVKIPDGGLVLMLDTGKSYTFEEDKNNLPANYKFDKYTNTKGSTTADGNTFDLTGDQKYQPYSVSGTVYNKPDPKIRITKKDSTTGSTSTALKKAEFAVYTKLADGQFQPVLGSDGKQIKITANNSFSGVRLPIGTYYLAETKVPDGFIDPNKVPAEYGSVVEQGTDTATGKNYSFFEAVVNNGSKSNSDNQWTITVNNIPNKASVTVIKNIDDARATVAGFTVTVTGQISSTQAKRYISETDSNGSVTFTDVQVYDADGNKITYKVEEGSFTSEQEDLYYKVFDGQTLTLTPNTNNDKDSSGATLHVDNETYTEIESSKFYQHGWEYQFTQMDYPMSGVKIGLFELDGTTYKYVKDITTGADGAISFDHLRRDKSYAIVELSSTDEYMYPYDYKGTGEFLEFPAAGVTEISAADLAKYNARTISAEDKTTTPIVHRDKVTDLADLYNRDHWVQFQITKWVDKDIGVHGTEVNPDEDSKYNNAVFELYRIVVPEGKTALTESDLNGNLFGTYISGTAYYADGSRADGVFLSRADQETQDNIVYVLVEKNAGPNGAIVNPNFKYTIYQKDGLSKYSFTAPTGYTARTGNYHVDSVTYDIILNSRDSGPGEGAIIPASVRIAKWADAYDESTGELKNRDFTALPNAKFELWVKVGDEYQKIEDLVVGLDNSLNAEGSDAKAWAQSAAYALEVAIGDDTGTLHDYVTETNYPVKVTQLNANAETDNIYVFAVEAYIKETEAPEGYTYEKSEMPMYMCFVATKDAEGKLVPVTDCFNDLFYVTPRNSSDLLVQEQFGIASYVDWGTEANPGHYASGFNYSGQYRIVDYPMQDTLVRVSKYGYEPTKATLNMTGAELDAIPDLKDRIAMAGVTMKLEKYDTADKAYKTFDYIGKTYSNDSSKYTFVTRSDGSYIFAKGLPEGQYRITETDLASYANSYEMAYKSGRERIFTVGKEPVTIAMYNPEKSSIEIVKKDTDEKPVSDAAFTLTSSSGTKVNGTTGTNGRVVFTDLATDTYTLTESAAGLSSDYLAKYLEYYKATAGNIIADSASKTINIGYEYANNSGATTADKDVVITSINRSFEGQFEIINPKLSGFTLEKVDETNTSKALSGATFDVYYKPFSSWNGTETVPVLSAFGEKVSTLTTGEDGIISLANKEPGFYALKETAAPAGYDIIKDKSGNDIVFYVVLTGNMPVTVDPSGIPQTATIRNAAGADADDVTITTYFKDPGDTAFTVVNRPVITAKASKIITERDLEDALSWEVKIDLYKDSAFENLAASATVKSTNTAAVEFNNKLSQDTTYYVKETVTSTPARDYQLDGFKIYVGDDTEGTTVGENSAITINGPQEIRIEATNTYMRGVVLFAKHDTDDFSKLLSGASFTVCAADGVTAIEGASVVEQLDDEGKGTGIYVADIPLTSKDTTTYTIVETASPYHYLLENGLKLTVQLSAEHNYIDWSTSDEEGQYLNNKYGWFLTVEKYGNVKSQNPDKVPDSDNIAFTVYQLDGDIWKPVEQKTVEDGQAQWLLQPHGTYAFAETRSSEKYVCIDGVYAEGSDISYPSEEITVQGESGKVEAFIVNDLTDDLVFKAYNKPWTAVKIIKEDAGNYHGEKAMAEFKIYDLGSTPLPTDKAEAEALIATLNPADAVYSGTTTFHDDSNKAYDIWYGADPDKNYVVVETKVESGSNAEYNTLNKDDGRVVWFRAINATEEPSTTDAREFILDNVYGDASVTLTKTPVESGDVYKTTSTGGSEEYRVPSLLAGERQVTYTVAPAVTTHNQPLSSFSVTDSGIVFDKTGSDYAINSIVIGNAAQADVQNSFVLPDGAVVSAKVIWDNDTEHAQTYDFSGEAVTVTAPAGAKTFKVEYYSEAVKAATEKYVLGEGFSAGAITVNVTVQQQAEGAEVEPITSFTNSASTELSYLKWKADGSEAVPVNKNDTADAVIKVDPVDIPAVSLNKVAGDPDVPGEILNVEPKGTVPYTISIKNEGGPGNFINPVVLDFMPEGVSFGEMVSVKLNGVDTEAFKVTRSNYNGEPADIQGAGASGDVERAIVFEIEGSLAPNDTLTITYSANVSGSIALYGDKVENDVFLSSNAHTYKTKDNPNGFSFKLDDGEFASDLATAAHLNNGTGETTTKSDIKLGKLSNALADTNFADGTKYVWLKNYNVLAVSLASENTLTKAIQGDMDAALRDDDEFIATATRTNSTKGDETEGWVRFRLSVVNGSDKKRYNPVVGDIIPGVGDARDSVWNTVFNKIEGIAVNGAELKANYTVYYYHGAYSALTATAEGNTTNFEKLLERASVNGTITDADWNQTAEGAKAFAIVFDKDQVKINAHQTLVVSYLVNTEDIPDDSEFAKVEFENDYNTFYISSIDENLKDTGIVDVQKSNEVKVQLTDGRVKVGGDVWVDEDWDGLQEYGGNRRDYSEYAIINKLAQNIKVSLTDNRKSEQTIVPGQSSTVDGTDVGESILHYGYSGLGAAKYMRGNLYDGDQLNTAALKTTDPYNYYFSAEWNKDLTDAEREELLSIFELTSNVDKYYYSDDPNDIPDDVDNRALDNNFLLNGSSYLMKPFYLSYGPTDNTKDIGFKMYRDLEIDKIDSETGLSISGAKFQLFSVKAEGSTEKDGAALWFTPVTETVEGAEGEEPQEIITSYVYDFGHKNANSVQELVTNVNGKILIEGLNWWKEYIIEETAAAPGYTRGMASAEAGNNGTVITKVSQAVWKLGIPAESMTAKLNMITVSNVPERNLTITKVDSTNEEKFIANAEFQVYGPFEQGQAALTGDTLKFEKKSDGSYALLSDQTAEGVNVLKSDENGQIRITKLEWWKEYVIAETNPAAGYSLMNAVAVAAPGTTIRTIEDQSAWVLEIPGEGKEGVEDAMTVKNTPTRDLEIIKKDLVNQEVLIPGAKFSIYGPFEIGTDYTTDLGEPIALTEVKAEDGTVISYAADVKGGTVTVLTTDANGKIKVTGLERWKEYVIEETEPAPGYNLYKVSAASDNYAVTQIDNEAKWVLKTTKTETATDDQKDEVLTVSNLPVRDLEILKKDSKSGEVIEGAKFSVYGPFEKDGAVLDRTKKLSFVEIKETVGEEEKVVAYAVDHANAEGSVTELVTNAEGKIKITGLERWKEYIIEETEPAPGYMLYDVAAGSSNSQLVKFEGEIAVWVLKTPSDEKAATYEENVTVSNHPLGKIIIEKDLKNWRSTDVDTLFAFEVKAVYTDSQGVEKLCYNDIVTMTFTAAGKQRIVIDGFPVGAKVTVTEVYAGNEYYQVDKPDKPVELEVKAPVKEGTETKDNTAIFEFINNHDDHISQSGGVTNYYSKGDDEGWSWIEWKIPAEPIHIPILLDVAPEKPQSEPKDNVSGE